MAISSARSAPKPARAWEVVLERGLLTEAELDDIFSAQNLMHPAYKAKRYTDESEQ
jgi:aspartate ammonia-lyase